MADQPITGLPTKTASGVAATDKMLGIDSAEGYQILVRDVAKYIIENCDVSTLAGAVRTPKAAIDLLNSNMTTLSYNGTVSNLQTSLQTLVSSLLVDEYRRIKYTPTETSGQFVNGHLYEGFFSRTGSNYWSLTLEDPEGQPVYGTYRNGTWAWDKLAEQTQIDALNSNTIKSTSGNHVVSTLFDSSFIVLRFSDGTSFTNLVFYDNGKVELTRWADNQWKAGVVLRQADS